MLGAHERYGRESWLLDVTSDLGIPVFVAVSRRKAERRTAGGPESLLIGLGAHVNPRLALRRAVTELNQMIAASAALPEDGRADLGPDLAAWLSEASLASQPHLAPLAGEVRVITDAERKACADDVHADLAHCRRAIEKRGMEVLVLDQTRPDIGLPVAKVLVPGLRHFWPRFAPGRLYDAPVTMGWRSAPADESSLNPIAMFL